VPILISFLSYDSFDSKSDDNTLHSLGRYDSSSDNSGLNMQPHQVSTTKPAKGILKKSNSMTRLPGSELGFEGVPSEFSMPAHDLLNKGYFEPNVVNIKKYLKRQVNCNLQECWPTIFASFPSN
jgi:hypothetical protein